MRPTSATRFAIASLLCLISDLPSTLKAQSTILNDTFLDGERATQNLPNSVAWYVGQSTPAALAVKNGVMESVSLNNLSRNFWAYFPVVSLKVGEAIMFAFDFSFTGGFVPEESAMRLGLCYTNGVAPRTSDGPVPVGNYQGYGSMSYSNNGTGLRKRNGPGATDATAPVLSTIGLWSDFGNTPLSPKPAQIDTPYRGMLKIVRTGPDTATITSSFTGGNLTDSSTVTRTDPSSIFVNFDTVIFNFPNENLNSIIRISRAQLTVSSLALFTTQPVTRASSLGADASFTVAATGSPTPAFQWQRKALGSTVWANIPVGGSYAGVTTATLTVANVTGAMEGDQFRVVATNSAGEVFSDPATLTLSVARITNLSVLTGIASAGDAFTMGYVVGGAGTSGSKSILVRAAGPSLVPLGVSGVLEDPRLELFASSTRTAENDNWGGTSALSNAFSSVGAFAYTSVASRDAAALALVAPGDNSVRVSATGTGVGTVIAELYDSTPAVAWTGTTPRLINVSILKDIGSGLTAGFVIGGNKSQTVLIRAIGPTLGAPPFNVAGVIADPKLELFAGPAKIGENDDWGGTTALSAAFSRVGAFTLPLASKDAGIVATLPPGNYSVQVSGVAGTGVGLVEIYEVP